MTQSNAVMDEALLDKLQRQAFNYFLSERTPENGLVRDNTRQDAHASIAAVGLALACYPVGVEHGWIERSEAASFARTTLQFFWRSEQSEAPHATGYRGFYYHFLRLSDGRRVSSSELSTIDTAILLAGALTVARYFDADDTEEVDIRALADALYRRADWQWALGGGVSVSHGWTPERGFLRARWQGYNEGLLLYALALGSPTFPVSPEGYTAFTETYRWKTLYGHGHLYAGPLFIHQIPHVWIDFRRIQDTFMRRKTVETGVLVDYFENSRRATHVQRAYATRNPRRFEGYGPGAWGVTASAGPGPDEFTVSGKRRRFWGYRARGIPWGPDDGTLSPWAMAASLPFAPEIVLPSLYHLQRDYPEMTEEHGIQRSFNPTYPQYYNNARGWVAGEHYGLDLGPVVTMVENHRSELIWRLMRGCPYLVAGLRRAGFEGGWLDEAP